ncbi:MAG TPA: ribonuclease P protein component [Candidatus Nitrosotenuis sp.]|nr:ribonuclease P protein component [Candidatus Nitrosotenuis sp.]
MRFAFPRECRLLRRAEFEAVYRGGRRQSGRHFVVFLLPRAENGAPSRFGTSVKRALGGAVVRNRIRRRIREILRLHRQEFLTGWDMVIHPRATVARAKFASLATELTALIAQGTRPRA